MLRKKKGKISSAKGKEAKADLGRKSTSPSLTKKPPGGGWGNR